MANSIALTILQGPNDGQPLATPIVRNFNASQIIYFLADTGITNATAKVYIKEGKANGQTTGDYLVSTTIASLVAAFPQFIQLALYATGPQGDNISATPVNVYYSPLCFQNFWADANTGVTSVATQVSAIFPV